MPEPTNADRAERGVETINRYLDVHKTDDSPGGAAADAITDILHAYCNGCELEAEELLRRAKMHFVAECDEQEGREDA